jgi:hypothetical protein
MSASLSTVSLSMVPRAKDMNDVSWLFKTRRYISRYDVYEAYKLLYGAEPKGIPTAEEMANVFETDEDREARITVKIVSHDFKEWCVENYLNKESTRKFGIALAIEFRMLEQIINVAENSDIFLYLTEHSLNEKELSLIIKSGLMDKLSKRIIDKSEVMYTRLTENFLKLLKIDDCGVINVAFISGYIAHASFYDSNPLLRYILQDFPDSHPAFKDLDSLAWDPFTKSRRFSHWLKVSHRMDELSKYYLEIKSVAENIDKNKEYISNYLEFKSIYAEDIYCA